MNEDIELHIEKLVLHGFDGCNAAHISAAVQQEIGRLLQEKGLPASFSANKEIGFLSITGNLPSATGLRHQGIGNHIAQLIFNGTTR